MNRKIEYRAWHKLQQKMYYNVGFSMVGVQVYKDEYIPEVILLNAGKDLFEIMQFTGLFDKDGKKAFDRDIYRNLDSGLIGLFTIRNGVGGLYVHTDEYKDGQLYNSMPFMRLDTTNFELVGNIFQNPELLTNLDQNKDE